MTKNPPKKYDLSLFIFRVWWAQQPAAVQHHQPRNERPFQGQRGRLRGAEELREQVLQQQDRGQVPHWRHQRQATWQPLPPPQSLCKYYFLEGRSQMKTIISCTLQRNFYLCIPKKGTARPPSRVPMSTFMCLYSPRSVHLFSCSRICWVQTDLGNI